jgi:thiol-disulfide isomerase/thioredoxin
MSDKRPKGVPYGYTNAPDSSGGSRTGLYVIGAVVALVVIAGIVALVMTSESSDDTAAADAVQEQGSIEVTGQSLPEYPADGGLFADPATDPAVGMTPPTLTGQDFQGQDVTIEPGGGTPMVVVFAAHWCPHCQKEIPLIQDWIDEGNLPDDVQVNLISTNVQADQNNYPPSDWLASVGWSEPILLDNPDQTAAQAYGLTGYPYLVFVDADGKVVQRASGELPIEQFGDFVAEIAV